MAERGHLEQRLQEASARAASRDAGRASATAAVVVPQRPLRRQVMVLLGTR